jgi:hypothetical protein
LEAKIAKLAPVCHIVYGFLGREPVAAAVDAAGEASLRLPISKTNWSPIFSRSRPPKSSLPALVTDLA